MIYGHRSSHLLTATLPAATCEACGRADGLQLHIESQYAHVNGVPLLPLGKTGNVHCRHCQHVFQPKQLPRPLKRQYLDFLNQAHTPLKHFAALLAAGLLALGTYGYALWQQHESETLLAHPHIGDIYHIRTEAPGYYTLLKVVEVNGNSVRLRQNNFETDREAEVDQLDLPKYYDSEPFDLTQLDLLIMRQQQELVAVRRPE